MRESSAEGAGRSIECVARQTGRIRRRPLWTRPLWIAKALDGCGARVDVWSCGGIWGGRLSERGLRTPHMPPWMDCTACACDVPHEIWMLQACARLRPGRRLVQTAKCVQMRFGWAFARRLFTGRL